MPDHKWDRFKRLFGAEDSDTLVQARLGKVDEAIQSMTTALTRMQDRGLPTLLLNASLVHLDQRRTVALQLANNRQKGLVLQGIKRDARRAAAQAEQTATQAIQTLDSDLETHTRRVRSAITKASNMRCPLVVRLLATPKQQLETARDQAESQSSDHRKRNAYVDIDTAPVVQLYDQLKGLNTDYARAKAHIRDAGWGLDKVPDDETTRVWRRKHVVLKDRLSTLEDETELVGATREATSLRNDAAALAEDINVVVQRIEREVITLGAVRRAVQGAIDRAESLTHKMGKAVVDSELQKVKLAQSRAELLVQRVPVTKALEQIDLNVLIDAIIKSSDLDLGVPALMAAIPEVLKKVESGGTKDTLTERLEGLQTRLDTANNEADLPTAKDLFARLKSDAKALMDEVIEAAGAEGFQTALEQRFELTVEIKEGSIVDLERTYRMMELVPESHVGHDKVKKLNFEPKPTSGALGSYGSGTINMKGIRTDTTDTYKLDGETHKPNMFNVTMLHEIGHAVDDKYSIMGGVMDTAGYGQWRPESRESVLAVFTNAALDALGDLEQPIKTAVGQAIGQALDGKDVTQPEGLNRRQRGVLARYTTIADTIRDKNQPYFNTRITESAIGGRVYLQAYASSNRWFSYAVSDYGTQKVNDYQWRAPGEWFAEIYAICWIKNKQKPTGVGPKLERWLPTA
jgi:uncharacterized protein YoxC